MQLSDEAVAAPARVIGIEATEIASRKAFLEFGETDVRLLTERHARLTSPRLISIVACQSGSVPRPLN